MHVKVEAKIEENKIRVSGLVHAYTWTTLCAPDQAYIRSLNYAHVGFCPEA